MPKITVAAEKKEIEVKPGSDMRTELRTAGVEVYSGIKKYLNCMGMGLCGECRVLVKKGMENVSPKGFLEKVTLGRMLSAIGHEHEMRLSCQCTVNGDCTVEVRPEMNWSGETFWERKYPNK